MHPTIRISIAALALALGTTSAWAQQSQQSAPQGAGGYSCPTSQEDVANGTQRELERFTDSKGGVWTLVCTNAWKTPGVGGGDFVWRYDQEGAKAVKDIGHCMWPRGQNKSGRVKGADGNVGYFWQTSQDRDVDGNKLNDAWLFVWDKAANTGKKIKIHFDKDSLKWRQVCADPYSGLPTGAGACEAVNACPCPPADHASLLYLRHRPVVNTVNNQLYWDMGTLKPTLAAGDYVDLCGLAASELVSSALGFQALTVGSCVRLRAMTNIALHNGDVLATIRAPITGHIDYAVVDSSALEYFQALMASNATIQKRGLSNRLDLSDMPGYQSTIGSLDLGLLDAYGDITTSQEVPAPGPAPNARGQLYCSINTANNTLTYHFVYSGLSSAETNAHIHGPAPRGVAAGVLFTLPLGAIKKGTWTYPQAQEANILNGLTYVNIHTVNNASGEIRGQIEPDKASATVPTLGQWGLIALSLLLFGAGAALMTRRRVMDTG